MDALIGYTGFVGGNLARQRKFDELYNSANIQNIAGRKFSTIFCAGVPGTKWLANREPKEDKAKINRLLQYLAQVQCKKLVLISSVDVYKHPVDVDEDTPLIIEGLHTYGRHRVVVEQFVRDNFADSCIVRLPAIYGEGIKKNFVYDLLHRHCLDWTHRDSIFQFYHLKHLFRDITTVLNADIKLVNINAQPISARELARECFGRDFTNITPEPPLEYDVKTIWADVFSGNSPYIYAKDQVLKDITQFVSQWHTKNQS